MNAEDLNAIDLAAARLHELWGSPISERDYALGVLTGLLLGGQDGQTRTEEEVLRAAERAVELFRNQKRA